MIQAFVAAHAVHFLVVGVLFLTFERPLLVHRPGQAAIVIATGSSLIAALAFTAGAKRPLLVAIRLIALSIASSVFFAAFFRHAVRPLRLIAVALVVAALLRLTRGFTFWTMRAKPT